MMMAVLPLRAFGCCRHGLNSDEACDQNRQTGHGRSAAAGCRMHPRTEHDRRPAHNVPSGRLAWRPADAAGGVDKPPKSPRVVALRQLALGRYWRSPTVSRAGGRGTAKTGGVILICLVVLEDAYFSRGAFRLSPGEGSLPASLSFTPSSSVSAALRTSSWMAVSASSSS